MGSDYREQLQRYTDVSATKILLATDDYSATPFSLAAAKAGWQIFVQKIEVAVTTDNAATLTFQDTAGTPIKIAGTKVSPGIGPITFDFGPDGVQLTADKGLDLKNSAAGLAASITVTAYRRLTPGTAIGVAALAAS